MFHPHCFSTFQNLDLVEEFISQNSSSDSREITPGVLFGPIACTGEAQQQPCPPWPRACHNHQGIWAPSADCMACFSGIWPINATHCSALEQWDRALRFAGCEWLSTPRSHCGKCSRTWWPNHEVTYSKGSALVLSLKKIPPLVHPKPLTWVQHLGKQELRAAGQRLTPWAHTNTSDSLKAKERELHSQHSRGKQTKKSVRKLYTAAETHMLKIIFLLNPASPLLIIFILARSSWLGEEKPTLRTTASRCTREKWTEPEWNNK